MKTFEAIMDFEANRPFENWYGTRLEFIVAKDVKERLEQLAGELKFTADEKTYLDKIKIMA